MGCIPSAAGFVRKTQEVGVQSGLMRSVYETEEEEVAYHHASSNPGLQNQTKGKNKMKEIKLHEYDVGVVPTWLFIRNRLIYSFANK